MTRPLDAETLLAHSGWVWRLARSLVADDPTADDVLQDTMVAALERSPRTGEPGTSLQAWLSTVARRLALRRRRADTRRDDREHSAARPIELPAVDRVLEREGARRKLVEHVLALDDAYRDTILLHYFDELPQIEIARRLGVPDSTVRNRLRRGLAQLHDRLERERGEEWRQWCLLLAPAGLGGTHTSLFSLSGWSAGFLAMATKLALLLVAAAAALATIFSWHNIHRDGGAPSERPAIAVRSDSPVAPVDRSPIRAADVDDASSRAQHRLMQNAGRTADLVGVLCFGTVRTRDGIAITSGTISIEDPIGRKRECSLDARGWYSFAGIVPGHWTLRAGCEGYRPLDLTVDLAADPSVDRRDLVLDAATLLNVRIRVDSEQKPSKAALGGTPWTVVATRDSTPAKLGETVARRHYVYGIGKYQAREPFGGRNNRIPEGYDGLLEVDEALPCYVTLALRHIVIETKLVPVGATEVEFHVDPAAGSRLLAQARVRVVDADTGAPLHPAHVALNPCDTAGGGVQTDEDGVAVLERLLPGPLELSVNAKDHEWFQRTVEIEPSDATDLGTLRIPRSCRISGTVVDENGAPVSIGLTWIDAEVATRPDRFRAYYGARSDSKGRFEFDSVPRGKLLLWSSPFDQEWTHACAAMDTSAGNLEGVVLRVERGRAIGIEIDRTGNQRGGWMVRRSDGVAMVATDWFDRGPTPLRLADGSYRVEVWSDGSLVRAQDFSVSSDGELIRVKL